MTAPPIKVSIVTISENTIYEKIAAKIKALYSKGINIVNSACWKAFEIKIWARVDVTTNNIIKYQISLDGHCQPGKASIRANGVNIKEK